MLYFKTNFALISTDTAERKQIKVGCVRGFMTSLSNLAASGMVSAVMKST